MESILKYLQNIKPRAYQEEIYSTCKDKNCLVVLPTGLGKTLIALLLAIDRLVKFPDEKILFLAPTRPLAEQHLGYFKKHLPELFSTMELFTGKTDAEKRKLLWQNAEIIFSTPQCIGNDLKNNLYDLHDVSLLIIDECHRCLKNYAYTYVAKTYNQEAKNPRLLGLTASPGHEKIKIDEISKNLDIEAVEIRTRNSEDVTEYLQELKFEIIKLDFPAEFQEIKELLKVIYDKKVQELQSRKLLFGVPNKKTLLDCQFRIMRAISSGNKNFNLLLGASACAQALKLSHAIELVETQTLYSFHMYIQSLFEDAKQQKSKAVTNLVKSPEFNQSYVKLVELLAKKQEHPKLIKLKEIIQEELKNNPKFKAIVFAQFRDTVTKISKTLNELPGIVAKVFVGQTKKGEGKNETGLSQKEQQEIIREFSQGTINVLVATSLHPDEFIIIKKEDKIMIKKIGEFVNLFIKKDSNESQKKEIKNWEALTTDGKELFFKPITHVHKHPTENNIQRIVLNSGFDAYVTENHSLFTFEKDKNFVPSISEKDKFVAFSLKINGIEIIKKIDILREIVENADKTEIQAMFGSLGGLTQAKIRILKTNLKILSKLNKPYSITEITKLSKTDYTTVMNCLSRLKKERFIKQKRGKTYFKNISEITKEGEKYLKFLKWFFKNIKYHKRKYRFRLKEINENIDYFNNFFEQYLNVNYGKTKFPRVLEVNEDLAKFLGFYVSEGSARKTSSTSDIFLAARNKEMQRLMKESIKKGLKLKPRVNWRGVAIDSQIVYHLIKSVFRAGIGAYNKEVPEIIFTSPNHIKWAFLEAYYLGDGYSDSGRIVFTTVSRKLVTGLNFLLRTLGVRKITLQKQKHIYRLVIFENLPFIKIKDKNEKRGHAYYNLIPNALSSEKAFEKFENFYSNSGGHLKCRKNGNWANDICFDYIKKIENLEKTKYVYDLSVKGTENFVGGTGLFCLHNSIAEEGLDIPEVSAVIFYEPIPSAIRQIQRRGRTARLEKGKLIMLITKSTRDESYYWAAFHKEKKMYKLLDDLKLELEEKEIKDKDKQKKLY